MTGYPEVMPIQSRLETCRETELGFAKIGTDWSLAVRVREGKKDPRSGDFDWYPLPIPGRLGCSMLHVRFESRRCSTYRNVLEALKSKADEAAATIREAKKLIK